MHAKFKSIYIYISPKSKFGNEVKKRIISYFPSFVITIEVNIIQTCTHSYTYM